MSDDNTSPVDTPPVDTPPAPPVENPPPVHVPDPPREGGNDDLRDTVKELVSTVGGLVTAVAALAPQSPDKTPVKVPWTHKGGRY